MSFFFVDDQLQANRKIHDLVESDGAAGVGAVGMWTLAGSLSKAKGSNGVTREADLIRLVLDKRLGLRFARLLVRVGLWHDHAHACAKCPPVEKGSFLFHDWYQFRYAEASVERLNRDRKKELKDEDVLDAVWIRDGDGSGAMGWCRYCDHQLKRKDNRSLRKPAIDHVIPNEIRGVENLVLACQPCNQKKGARTPQQAEMPLLPPHTSQQTNAGTNTEPTPDQGRYQPRYRPGPSSPHREGDGDGDGVPGLGTGDAAGELLAEGWLGAPAGDVPVARGSDLSGSPWLGHSGPFIDPPPESMCQAHGTHLPCAKCASERFDREADQ